MKHTAPVFHKTLMESIVLKSYAKVNLTLDVFPPRPDGYHDIRSIMQTISLHDIITIHKAPHGTIEVSVNAPGVPPGEGNLAYKAAVLVQEAAGRNLGVQIRIQKSIPVQAGLGGGSSNAAATLVGLNRLFGLGLGQERLLQIAAELGSDVPFFIIGGTVLAEGRGEILTELNDAPSLALVVVKPDIGVPTASAYSALDAITDRQPGQATEAMLTALESGRIDKIAESISNDFEQVVFPEFPFIEEISEALIDEEAEAAALCGSGSAVFGIFDDENRATEVADKLKLFGKSFMALSIDRSEALVPWL